MTLETSQVRPLAAWSSGEMVKAPLLTIWNFSWSSIEMPAARQRGKFVGSKCVGDRVKYDPR